MKDPDKTENRMTLTIKETASLLGISLPTCYALANREDFPGSALWTQNSRQQRWTYPLARETNRRLGER